MKPLFEKYRPTSLADCSWPDSDSAQSSERVAQRFPRLCGAS